MFRQTLMPHCLLCGQQLSKAGTDSTPHLKDYCECKRCSVLIRSDGDSIEEDHYELAYSAPGEAAGYGEFETPAWYRWDEVQLNQMLEKQYLPRNGSLLDIGCGWGRLIKVARRKGIRGDGFEVSQTAAHRIEAQGVDGGAVFHGDLGRVNRHYDVATMFEVIEHLEEPRKTLRQAFEVCSEGGYLIGTTGNYQSQLARRKGDSWKYLQPEHIIIWSETALRRELKRAGFERVDVYQGLFPSIRKVVSMAADGGAVGSFAMGNPKAWLKIAAERLMSTSLTFVAQRPSTVDFEVTRKNMIASLT